MKPIFYISLNAIVLGALLCTACTAESDVWYHIPHSYKRLVPYQENENFYFIDETGKLVALTVDIENWWEFISTDADLQQYQERRVINLQSENDSHNISISMFGLQGYPTDFLPVIIHWGNHRMAEISYDGAGIPGNFSNGLKEQKVHDSLMIGGQMYHEVVQNMQRVLSDKQLQLYDTVQCCYNKVYGILQITENGVVFLERRPNP